MRENGRNDQELREPLKEHENYIIRTGVIPEWQRRSVVRDFLRKVLLYATAAVSAFLAIRTAFGESIARLFGGDI